jgi:hypothetical protein
MVSSPVDPSVAEADRKAAEEMQRFRAALPSLLADDAVRGRWVVFKDGAVVRAFDTVTEGRRWAVANLGRLSGFIVAPVAPPHVYRLGGAGLRLR